VAWDGTHFGVAYLESTTTGTTSPSRYNVYFALLNPDGTRAVATDLALTAFPAGSTATGASAPDIVWTGTEYGVLWPQVSQAGATAELMLQRVGPSGATIGASHNITAATVGAKASANGARLSWSPVYGGYAIASAGSSATLHFQRIGVDGTAPDPINTVPTNSFFPLTTPGIAVSPSGEWGVVFATSNTGSTVYLAFFNSDGSRTANVVTLEPSQGIGNPAILHDGTSWVTAWYTVMSTFNHSLLINRGTSRNSPYTVYADAAPMLSTPPPVFVQLALAGGALTVAYEHPNGTNYDFRMRRYLLPSSGAPTPISDTITILDTPTILYSNTAAMAVGSKTIGLWADDRFGANELYARSIDTLGCP
jgi:hypothetical protein